MNRKSVKKNPGKVFEEDFKKSATAQDLWILRLKDTSLSWLPEKNMRFTPKNIADFLIYKYPDLFVVECKSTNSERIGIQRTESEPDAMIAAHQIQDLKKADEEKGIHSFFLLNYRDDSDITKNIVYALSIRNFLRFLEETGKKSINKKDCNEYGGIIVPQTLKRTHYVYDILSQVLIEIAAQEE